MNNKASARIWVILIIAVIIIAGLVIGLSVPQPTFNADLTAYIDGVTQTGNYSAPQNLDWGAIQAGMAYTKNFTIANTGLQPYTISLLTSEPFGATLTWASNNTQLAPNSIASNSLILPNAVAGTYTWRLFFTNSTLPTATPTPNPSATPTPNNLNITISADANVESISISINNQANYTITSPNQRVIPFTAGATLKLYPAFVSGYELNGWLFANGAITTTNVLTLQNQLENVEVVCESKLIPIA